MTGIVTIQASEKHEIKVIAEELHDGEWREVSEVIIPLEGKHTDATYDGRRLYITTIPTPEEEGDEPANELPDNPPSKED